MFFLHISLRVLISVCFSLCVCADEFFCCKCTHDSLMLVLLHFPASLPISVIFNRDAASTVGKRDFEADMTPAF